MTTSRYVSGGLGPLGGSWRPASDHKQDRNTGEHDGNTDERATTSIPDAGVQHEERGTKEDEGSNWIERNPERPHLFRLSLPQHDERKRRQREKEPEDGGGVRHHRFETPSRHGPECHEAESNDALQKQRVDRGTIPFVPPAEQMKGAEIPGERVGAARAGDDGGIGGRQC
jgi:hypothetical protein